MRSRKYILNIIYWLLEYLEWSEKGHYTNPLPWSIFFGLAINFRSHSSGVPNHTRKRKSLWTFIPILLLLVVIIVVLYRKQFYIQLDTSFLPSNISFDSTTNTLSEGFHYIEHYGEIALDWIMSILSQASSYLRHGITVIHSLVNSFYYSYIDSYYQDNPMLVGSLLILAGLLITILFCFTIYFLCKLFLLLTDLKHTSSSSSSSSKISTAGSGSGNTMKHSHSSSSSSMKHSHHSPHTTTNNATTTAITSTQSSIHPSLHPYITFSSQPFSTLRSLCRTPSTQFHFNTFLELYLKRRYLKWIFHNPLLVISIPFEWCDDNEWIIWYLNYE